MSDQHTAAPESPPAVPKKQRRPYTRKAKSEPKPPAQPKPPSEFAGITPTTCPTACNSERCVISTVNVCKHPVLCPVSGCGPITLANRERAMKFIKHQDIDKGG